MPTWYEVALGLLGAFGGTAGVIQIIKTWRDWRAGVAQRDAAPTARLVAYLEGEVLSLRDRVAVLEAARNVDGTYMSTLVYTLAVAGVPVPARPTYGEGST